MKRLWGIDTINLLVRLIQELVSEEWSDCASICSRCPAEILIIHLDLPSYTRVLSLNILIKMGGRKSLIAYTHQDNLKRNQSKAVIFIRTCQIFAAALGDSATCCGTFLTWCGRPGSESASALGKGSLNPRPPLEYFLYSPDYLKY